MTNDIALDVFISVFPRPPSVWSEVCAVACHGCLLTSGGVPLVRLPVLPQVLALKGPLPLSSLLFAGTGCSDISIEFKARSRGVFMTLETTVRSQCLNLSLFVF